MTTSKTRATGAPALPTLKNPAIKTRIPGNKWFPGVVTWSDARTCEVDGKTIHVFPCSIKIGDGTRIWIDLSVTEGNVKSERELPVLHAKMVEASGGKRKFPAQLYLKGYTSDELCFWTEQYAEKARAVGAKVGEPLAKLIDVRVEDLG